MFTDATITGADFSNVLFRESARLELCKVAAGVNTVTGNATRDTLMCN